MQRKLSAFALTLLLLLTVAFSPFQTALAGDEPAASGKPVLKEGTEVKLKFADDLSSKTANEGDPVNLILDEDIKVGDRVVAKAGCKAVGTITNVGLQGCNPEAHLVIEEEVDLVWKKVPMVHWVSGGLYGGGIGLVSRPG